MIGIQLSKNDIIDILNMAELKGIDISGNSTAEITSFILFVGEKKTKISISNKEESITEDISIIPNKIFGVKEKEIIEIPISIEDTRKVLARFNNNDNIDIIYEKESNYITLRREKPYFEITYEAIAMQNISSTLTRPVPITFKAEIPSLGETEYCVRIDLDTKSFKEIIDDSKLGKIYIYPLILKDRKLFGSMKSKHSNIKNSRREIEVENIKYYKQLEVIENIFSPKFTSIFESLKGGIRIYLSNDTAMFIIKESKNYSANIILMNSQVEDDDIQETNADDNIKVEGVEN